jgi:hypothetical protein
VLGAYHQLWQIEKSFRMSKSDLRARPIYHHKRESIEAHLFAIAVVAFWPRPLRPPGPTTSPTRMAAPPRHGMGGSYIALLTAFYVDNGPFLPLWNRLPHWTYWLLPAVIGMPLIWRPLHRYLRSTSDKPSRARPHVVAGHETEKIWLRAQ